MSKHPTIRSLTLELDALCYRAEVSLKKSADEADSIRNSNEAAAMEIVILERKIDIMRGILQNKPQRMSALTILSFLAGRHSFKTVSPQSPSLSADSTEPFKNKFNFLSFHKRSLSHGDLKTRISATRVAQQFQEEELRREIFQCDVAISSAENMMMLQKGKIAELKFQLLQEQRKLFKYI
mmetsp:Transcript_43872/g.64449  ORF Transcript_43872/g.64449 Transcript_43872/m.64449 type:complete len:181 (-) Transcript_43872:94-636(-)